ncbi:DUF3530 family protein [Pseudocolwellia sp. HL-MZ7]|uniref:DUF3530 family protein n=1 Tax=Pseudocolwellia sp. HL-MZ7 TaxID=3400627 RepID=UPI003CF69405
MFRLFLITALFSLLPHVLGISQAHAFFYFQEEPAKSDEQENATKDGSGKLQRSDIKIAQPISSFELQKQDLNHYLPSNEVELLKAGDNEYTLIKGTSSTKNDKGVAILIPDWQQGLTNAKALNFLRKELPTHGWATLSIQSPNKPSNYPSSASTQSELAEQNKVALMPYKNELKSLMMEVMKKAKDYPGIFLVITQGSQAAMLIDLYKNNEELLPSTLVILSGGMYSHLENDTFAHNIATSELPILDLILKRDSRSVLENALLRKKYSNKELKVFYRQKSLSNIMPGYYPEQSLIIEINGWLKSIGW